MAAPKLKLETLAALPEKQRLEEMVKGYNALREEVVATPTELERAYFHDLELNIPANTITYTNSWANQDGTNIPARFYRNRDGITHLEARVINTSVSYTSSSSDVLTLPVGFRPSTYVNPVLQEISRPRVIASAHRTTDQTSVANATFTVVDFSTVSTDTHSGVTTGASWKFTAPKAGYYRIEACATWNNLAGGAVLTSLRLYKNGSVLKTFCQGPGAPYGALTGGGAFLLAASDYIDVRAYHEAGSAQTLVGNSTECWINIYEEPFQNDVNFTVNSSGVITIWNPIRNAWYSLTSAWKSTGVPLPFSRDGGVVFGTPFRVTKLHVVDCRNREDQTGLAIPNVVWSPIRQKDGSWAVKIEDMPGVEADTKYKISFMCLP